MHRIMLPMARRAAIVVVSFALVVPALAHAHLKAASPGIGATVHAAPKTITLTFSEGVVPKFSGAELADSAGKSVALGPAANGAGAATLSIPVAGTLMPGAYTVTWHAVATDSHRTKGSFRFTLAP